jgi:hypothetical protein
MTEPQYPVASTIGCGFILNNEGDVGVLITLGDTDETETEHITLAGIVLEPEVARFIVDKLTALIGDVEMAEEAVSTMGIDAAREYLSNWSKRSNAPLN